MNQLNNFRAYFSEALATEITTPDVNPNQVRRKGLLNLLLIVVEVFTLLVLIWSIFQRAQGVEDPGILLAIYATLFGLIAFGILFFVNQNFSTELAGSIFIGVLILILMFSDDPSEVVQGRTFFYLVLPVVMSGVILRSYASFIVYGVTAVLMIWFSNSNNLEINFIGLTGLLTVTLISWIGALSLERTLAQLYSMNINLDKIVEDRTDEVRLRTEELADANEQLKELDKLKSKFVSDVTHELRTPITNLTLYSDMLKSGHAPDKLNQYTEVISQNASQLMDLVDQTLILSRVDSGELEDESDYVDVDNMCRELELSYRLQAQAKGLNLTYYAKEGIPRVWGIDYQLKQVYSNLIQNAVNYTEGGLVQITLFFEELSGMVCLEIQDTGRGIPKEEQEHIFDRFYRGTNVSSTIPGTGLGLAIVKEIIDFHKGNIRITSDAGRGTFVRVCLPTSNETSTQINQGSPQEAQN